ncbi:MAG: kynureninase [Bacteroidetes bacterium]|nr:kynureninase [Bacteroidota bacterium]
MHPTNSSDYAKYCDEHDALSSIRSRYHFPQFNGEDVLYFTGNSLGLQPKSTRAHIEQELNDWAMFGVEGHFRAKHPWYSYHENLTDGLARVVGALPIEVVAMNQLTSNVHFLMASFYRPDKKRYKIITEFKAFPSDQYAVQTQVEWHGYQYEDAVIEIAPRTGEYLIHTEDILSAIEQHKDELALVFIGGVNYYTGQVFDMSTITKAAHCAGAYAGFDLAHAAGNIKMSLHDWQVDFACWCSYKYLNSGPGSVAGAFVHERHAHSNLPRLAGWWGHDKTQRFKMEKGFVPVPGAEGWQLSNAPVLSMAAHKAALDLFDEVGMDALSKKSEALTAFLELVIDDISARNNGVLEIITPRDKRWRGCQLSIVAKGFGKNLFETLIHNGVVPDWREPNVIRLAPVPMYNSFMDIWKFGQRLEECMQQVSSK